MSKQDESFSQEIFDGLCSATSTLIGIIGIVISALNTAEPNMFIYVGSIAFWGAWFAFSLFFAVKMYISKKNFEKPLESD